MYHDPQVALLVLLELDEVVAAAECAYLAQGRLLALLYDGHGVDVVTSGEV